MSAPGFTAGRAVYRGARAYASRSTGRVSGAGVVPAGNCGYFCDCDPGQCCEVSWGGLNCACKTCGTHLEQTMPQFLSR